MSRAVLGRRDVGPDEAQELVLCAAASNLDETGRRMPNTFAMLHGSDRSWCLGLRWRPSVLWYGKTVRQAAQVSAVDAHDILPEVPVVLTAVSHGILLGSR